VAEQRHHESLVTVLVAGAANLGIAIAKLLAGLVSGSAAMLSEAAHSFGDTVNEVLLAIAVHRGAHPADERHPFGYGKESFFWAFLATLATFAAGAGFAITHGIHTIANGETTDDYLLAYVVLAVSFVLEAASFLRATGQVRGAARDRRVGPLSFLRSTPNTALKAVVLEDAAALVGLVLAAVGVGLEELTGSSLWDGAASVAIGVLLVVVAVALALDNVSLLVGEAAPRRIERELRAVLEAQPGIDQVVGLQTMVIGPDDVLVAATVDFADGTDADVERAADDAQQALTERFPAIRHVFLDPTAADAP
jgi:cation diffusion facilitator family transporter